MRLLKSTTLTFEDFDRDGSTPAYAILSHTWGDDEVTYKEMRKLRALAERKYGFRKIAFCSQQAIEDGIDYIWVDTCCINKTSSAELSEAINSMYRWYQNAQVCYTYLSDTPERPGPAQETKLPVPCDPWIQKFQNSHWFIRGWTLQELIAPPCLIFYSREWTRIGTKEELNAEIEARTGVPVHVLLNGDLSGSSVAQKMSWAAERSTSRTEDLAYCLMGLFDVHMPMLYGEGKRSFIRLQEVIIKSCDDMSIFSWVDPTSSFSIYRGLLAKAPADFAQCRHMSWSRSKSNPPYQLTNKGIKMDSILKSRTLKSNEFITPLWGVTNMKMRKAMIGIYLQKVGEDQYGRVEPEQLALIPPGNATGIAPDSEDCALTTIFIRQKVVMEILDHSRAAGISLRLKPSTLTLDLVQPNENWNAESSFFSFDQPPWSQSPPVAEFKLVDTLGSITIAIDASKPWGNFVTVKDGWKAAEHKSLSMHRVHCRKPSQPMIEIMLQRGLFDSQSKILLSATRRVI